MANDFRHPPIDQVRFIIGRALDEDIGWGDITTETAIPVDQWSTGVLISKATGVLCGTQVFNEAFRMVDPIVEAETIIEDGSRIKPGDWVSRVSGPTRALLTAERTALNFVQRLSGIATVTAALVECLSGLPTRLIDTRKTTPGLRLLEKYAVRAGGGSNHRYNLADAVLLKDNHLAALQGRGMDLAAGIRAVRRQIPHTMRIEVEVTTLDQIEPALEGGADIILLDNMSVDDMRQAVAQIGDRAQTECSGTVTLETVRQRAETGVTLISSGAITHSAPALDLSVELVTTDER